MSADSSILDKGKSIESVDTWQNLGESDDPSTSGSLAHSSASMVNSSMASGGRLLDLWDDCDFEVAVTDDDFFDLLKSDDMCPPALKDNKVKSGWQNLVEFVRTAYEDHLARGEREGQTDSLTVFTYLHGQKTFVSFACTRDDDRIISVFFVVETPQYQTHECLSWQDHKDTHREFDMDFTEGVTDANQGSLAKKLMTLRKTASTVVSTRQTASGDAAWWRAFKRSNGRGGDDGLYRFYGVIHPSNNPARRDEPTAGGNGSDNDDEEGYDMIMELGKEWSEGDQGYIRPTSLD
jgi:hypothetical protein